MLKPILTWALLAVAVAAVGAGVYRQTRTAGAAPASRPAAGVTVYYFHGDVRCTACTTIETLARQTVEGQFAAAVADGRLAWREVNIDRPENAHFKTDYALSFSSVVLANGRPGANPPFKNLPQVWELYGNAAKFESFLAGEIRHMLEQ